MISNTVKARFPKVLSAQRLTLRTTRVAGCRDLFWNLAYKYEAVSYQFFFKVRASEPLDIRKMRLCVHCQEKVCFHREIANAHSNFIVKTQCRKGTDSFTVAYERWTLGTVQAAASCLAINCLCLNSTKILHCNSYRTIPGLIIQKTPKDKQTNKKQNNFGG